MNGFEESTDYSRYLIQKIEVPDASYLLLSSDNQDAQVEKLLSLLAEYLSLSPRMKVSKEDYQKAVLREISHKNLERLESIQKFKQAQELNRICGLFGFHGIEDYIFKLNQKIENELLNEDHQYLYFSHGDLCFSNLLVENDKLWLIDPKGAQIPEHNYRPIHYELAKISQSLLGHYDLINHELFQLENDKLILQQPLILSLSEAYFNKLINDLGTSLKSVRLVEASLFVSLLPFHQESEQKLAAFLFNSLIISSRWM